MRTLSLIFIAATLAAQDKTVLFPVGTEGTTGNIDTYNGDFRVEAYVPAGSCTSTGSFASLIRTGMMSIRLNSAGRLDSSFAGVSLAGGPGNAPWVDVSAMTSGYVLKAQRVRYGTDDGTATGDPIAGVVPARLQIEVWDAGTGQRSAADYNVAGDQDRVTTWTQQTRLVRVGNTAVLTGTCKLAWIHTYNTVTPLGVAPSTSAGASPFISFPFDDEDGTTAVDVSGNGHTMTFGSSVSHEDTAALPGLNCNAGVLTYSRGGDPISLDSSGSYKFGGTISKRVWQLESGPAGSRPRLSSHSATSPTVYGAIRGVDTGTHVWRLTVFDDTGASATCTTQQEIVQVVPAASSPTTVGLSFKLGDADKAQVRAWNGNGELVQDIECETPEVEGTCVLSLDAAYKNHIVQVDKKNAADGSFADGRPLLVQVGSGGATSGVVVPDVVGAAVDTSITTLQSLGLGFSLEQEESDVAEGLVIDQSPAPTFTVPVGTVVYLSVSSGAALTTVPNVLGLTQAEAQTSIASSFLQVGTVTFAEDAAPAGTVFQQSPTGGNEVARESSVDIWVATAAPQVEVPDIVGLTQSAANSAITAEGLTVGVVSFANHETIPQGEVISQDPAASTMVNVGTQVSFVVSSGPAGEAFPFSHIKTHIVSYTNPTNAIGAWMAARFGIMVGGFRAVGLTAPPDHRPGIYWAYYFDHSGTYTEESELINDFAITNGWSYPGAIDSEGFFWHTSIDLKNDQWWNYQGQFDGHDKSNGTWNNGALMSNDPDCAAGCTRSVTAYPSNNACFALGPNLWATTCSVTISEYLFLKSFFPYDEINFEVTTPQSGGTVPLSYWDGDSWESLTVTSDTTNGLTQSGRMRFVPPANWAKRSISPITRSGWWVRVHVSGETTAPVVQRVTGDDWRTITNGTIMNRGWAVTSGSKTTCCGGMDYDPTPPDGSTARFRWHSRVKHFFGNTTTRDQYIMNHSYLEGTVRPWTQYALQKTLANFAEWGYNAFMFDNVVTSTGKIPVNATSPNPANWRDFVDINQPYGVDMTAAFADFKDQLKAVHPNTLVGGNGSVASSTVGEWGMIESLIFPSSMHLSRMQDKLTRDTFDDALPDGDPNGTNSNPNGSLISYGFQDNTESDCMSKATGSGSWCSRTEPANDPTHYFHYDRGDRRPMAMLAFYYLGANDYTMYHYHPGSVNSYNLDDRVWYWTTNTSTLAADVDFKPSSTSVVVQCTDCSAWGTSGFVSIGYGTAAQEEWPYTRSGNNLTIPSHIYHDWPAGTAIKEGRQGSQLDAATMSLSWDRYFRWSDWYPAIAVNVGTPTGFRNMSFKTMAELGHSTQTGWPIWRRDYSGGPYGNTVVLFHPCNDNTPAIDYNTKTATFALDAGPGTAQYYRLHANGTTDASPVTHVGLAACEGGIWVSSAISTPPM